MGLDEVNDHKLMEELRNEKFDLIMGERNCFFAIAELANIKTHISVISSAVIDPTLAYLGVPSVASFVPGKMKTFLR